MQSKNKANKKENEQLIDMHATTAKRGLIYSLGEITSSIITLILLIILTRYLQPIDFGIYSIAIAFAAFIGSAGNFGIGTAFRKFIPQIENDVKKINRILSNGYFLALSLSFLFMIIGIILSNPIATYVYNNPNLAIFLIIASIIQFFTVLFNLSKAALTSFGKIKEAFVGDITYSLTQLIAVVCLILLGYGIFGALIGFVISLIAGALVYIFYLFVKMKIKIVKPMKKEISNLTKFSMPVFTSNIALLGVQNFSILLLGVFVAPVLIGNYSAAYKLSRFIEILVQALSFILLSAYAKIVVDKSTKNYKNISRTYNGSIYYTFLILLPISVYLISAINPITFILISKAYTEAPFYASVMIIGILMSVIGIYGGNLLLSHDHVKSFMKYQIIYTIIQFVMLVLFVPLYGVIGALYSLFIVAPLIFVIIYVYALKRELNIIHKQSKLIRLIIASIIVFLILIATSTIFNYSKITILTNMLVAFIIYPPILVLTKSVTRTNLDFLNKISKTSKIFGLIINPIINYLEIFIKE
ncbi:MAG: oligosaccharide flippase family protein [Candidatus Micrarchaeia archaeon]